MTETYAWPADEEHVEVVGNGLSAIVVPSRGGKVISLRDGRGVEWLAQPDRPVGAAARPGDDFLHAEMSGWDECAPTIVECVVDGVELADHGELWTKAFHHDGPTMSVHDDTLGYRFQRTILAAESGLIFSYEVTAMERAVPFLWAAHPQFRAPSGSWVRLPSAVETVVDVMDPAIVELPWAPTLGSIDTVPREGYRKIYAHPERTVSEAALVHPDGAALTMSWSSTCPYVGLWFDRFTYRAEPIIAIEPSTAYFDSLTTAMSLGRAPVIPAGETLAWTVLLRVDS